MVNRYSITGLVDWPAAAKYLHIESNDLGDLVRTGMLPHVTVPHVIPKSLRFRIVDLDRYLHQHTEEAWRPRPRIGRRAVLNVETAARYLDLSVHEVYRLARLGVLAHAGGGQGRALRFPVSDLDERLKEWAKAGW